MRGCVEIDDWFSKSNLAKSLYRVSLSWAQLELSSVLRLVYESSAIAIYGYVVVVLRVYEILMEFSLYIVCNIPSSAVNTQNQASVLLPAI